MEFKVLILMLLSVIFAALYQLKIKIDKKIETFDNSPTEIHSSIKKVFDDLVKINTTKLEKLKSMISDGNLTVGKTKINKDGSINIDNWKIYPSNEKDETGLVISYVDANNNINKVICFHNNNNLYFYKISKYISSLQDDIEYVPRYGLKHNVSLYIKDPWGKWLTNNASDGNWNESSSTQKRATFNDNIHNWGWSNLILLKTNL